MPLWAGTPDLWCEHRLASDGGRLEFQHYFRGLFDLPLEDRPAERQADVNAFGLSKFGIFAGESALTVTMQRSVSRRNSFIVFLKEEGETRFKSVVDVPPLYVWERDEGQVIEDLMFPSGTTWNRYGMGAVLENTTEYRRFLEIQRDRRGKVTLILGLDMECDRVEKFTRSSDRRFVQFRPEYAICRVPVIRVQLRN